MQKTSTQLNKTDFQTKNTQQAKLEQLQPGKETLKRILEFAGSYRVQQVAKNQYVELFLN